MSEDFQVLGFFDSLNHSVQFKSAVSEVTSAVVDVPTGEEVLLKSVRVLSPSACPPLLALPARIDFLTRPQLPTRI
jgi:hypothetical protein